MPKLGYVTNLDRMQGPTNRSFMDAGQQEDKIVISEPCLQSHFQSEGTHVLLCDAVYSATGLPKFQQNTMPPFTLKMDTPVSSKTLVNIYHTTQYASPKHYKIHNLQGESFKAHIFSLLPFLPYGRSVGLPDHHNVVCFMKFCTAVMLLQAIQNLVLLFIQHRLQGT